SRARLESGRCDDKVHRDADQFGRESRQSGEVALRETPLNGEILALDPTVLLQSAAQGFDVRGGLKRSAEGCQETDSSQLSPRRLPRQPPTPRQQPSASRAHDELPAAQPAHWSMTSVIWRRISWGKVIASSRAVFILTTKSKI